MKQRVLIADADRELCDLYRRFFLLRGYDVETANHGLDCLTKLRQAKPAAVILDFDLPWGGGDGVLDCMLEDDRLRSIPVVLLSAQLPPSRFSEDYNTQVGFSFLKPCRMDVLLDCIRALVGPSVRHLAEQAPG